MRVSILTISDSVSAGTRIDASGPSLLDRCAELGWDVVSVAVLPDDRRTGTGSRLLRTTARLT